MALREKRPGQISEELRKGLQIGDGEPPPWLINMQRYGPPPSYPSLKIPGLNAPIPEGASYGYHPGGWGKPPVDEFGRPLYGDVFGTAAPEVEHPLDAPVSSAPWGEMDPEEEEEEEDSDEEGEDGTAGDEESLTDGEIEAGISSVSSAPSGIATPDSVHLRKLQNDGLNTPSGSMTGADTPESVSNPQLYQVLEQREARVGGAAFGSSHAYVMPSAAKGSTSGGGGTRASGGKPGVEMALDPNELDNLDAGALKAKYDELRKAELDANAPEDVSDIIEEQERKRRKKLDAAKEKRATKF